MTRTPHAPGPIIFHHPGPVEEDLSAGSKVRPAMLLKAFRDLGYEVETVTGYAKERRKATDRLMHHLRNGRSFDFVYSESRSIPTLLTEPHRMPLHPWLDPGLLMQLRRADVPTGLFYRDIYWRFDVYRSMLGIPFRWLTIPLYRYDWFWYRHCVQHLFLPSDGMASHLPGPWPEQHMSALPPGAAPLNEKQKRGESRIDGIIELAYVGGIEPPLYDITPLLQLTAQSPQVRLTLCCRQTEWERLRSYYSPNFSPRVRLMHASGEALSELYQSADIIAILRHPHEYLDFAVPVKLFEAFSRGLPVLCYSGNEAARIIENEQAGWVVENLEMAKRLLTRLAEKPQEFESAGRRAAQAARKHAWTERAQDIADRLRSLSI